MRKSALIAALAAVTCSGFSMADSLSYQNYSLTPENEIAFELRADQLEGMYSGWTLSSEEMIEQLNRLPATAAGGVTYDPRIHWKRESPEMADIYQKPTY